MKIAHVYGIFFSATGTSGRGVKAVASAFGKAELLDLTRFDARPAVTEFGPEDLAVFGAPVYGGRIYKGAAERFSRLKGNDTPCIVTVTYGNRDYVDWNSPIWSGGWASSRWRPPPWWGNTPTAISRKAAPTKATWTGTPPSAGRCWQNCREGTSPARRFRETGLIKRAGTAASSIP